jgi:hypothetical protein
MKTAKLELTKDELWAIHISIINLGDIVASGQAGVVASEEAVQKFGESIVSLGKKMDAALKELKQ